MNWKAASRWRRESKEGIRVESGWTRQMQRESGLRKFGSVLLGDFSDEKGGGKRKVFWEVRVRV
ncbi:hypothetical protein SLEP1_g48695 [Rubroshorea leprosula]|uniref:Uncharacterized protein n=1 Tax=Rubroshorea leprosula TaxID=152421 RepID=A0AAV5LUG9_9ROSI|nr:hypothetical protein SLEP1_g48695 [Rubroshorea leprosula]